MLEDGDDVKLGGGILVVHRTSGPTRGCTTWTWNLKDDRKTYDVIVIDSPNFDPGYRLLDSQDDPEIADDFARTFKVLKALPCDVFLGAHGRCCGMAARYESIKKTCKANPFGGPEGYRAFVAQTEEAFFATLTAQRARQSR